MSDVPKIVADRLRAQQPQGTHPDADVLTAFAEQALPSAEREGVVAHLASCRECRDVVAVSLPALEEVGLPQASGEKVAAVPAGRAGTPRRNWFVWPNLAWGALAAGVIVAAAVLVMRTGQQPESTVATMNSHAGNTVPAAPEAKLTAPAAVQLPAQVAATPPARIAKADEAMLRAKPELRLVEPAAGTRAYPTPPTASADRKRSDSLDADKLAREVPSAPAKTVGGLTYSDRVSASEAATVTAGAAVVAQAPAEGRLQAHNEPLPAIAKAKAPAAKEQVRLKDEAGEVDKQALSTNAYSSMQESVMSRAAAKSLAPQWSLAQGALFRSAGKTWKVALRGTHPLLSFGALGSDIWAGGQAGSLFHSRDSGTTWEQIQPSTKDESLTSNVTAIEIRSATEIVVTTSNNEFWITVDGGKSWEKK